jgi:NitT/TauT family transport system ATP-binding protein
MSKRPGRIVARQQVDLPRPRDLEITYTRPFAELVLGLRERIGAIRRN